jgi:type II secretory pathway pseudopilin PulG
VIEAVLGVLLVAILPKLQDTSNKNENEKMPNPT